jgi:ABC-type transport system substrate-binding protein
MNVLMNIFDTLTVRDVSDKLVGGLAERWESTSPKTWRFHLRGGVTFHNGEPCDATAVKYSIERLTDPATKSPIVELRFVTKVDVVEDHTVDVLTSRPDPILPEKMSLFGGVIGAAVRLRPGQGQEPARAGRLPERLHDQVLGLVGGQGHRAGDRGSAAEDRCQGRRLPAGRRDLQAAPGLLEQAGTRPDVLHRQHRLDPGRREHLQSFIRHDRRQSRWNNPDADKLVDAEEGSVQPAARKQAFTKLQQLMGDEAPFLLITPSRVCIPYMTRPSWRSTLRRPGRRGGRPGRRRRTSSRA